MEDVEVLVCEGAGLDWFLSRDFVKKLSFKESWDPYLKAEENERDIKFLAMQEVGKPKVAGHKHMFTIVKNGQEIAHLVVNYNSSDLYS